MCIFGSRSVAPPPPLPPAPPPPLPPAPTAPPPDPVVQEVNPQVADAMDERSDKRDGEQTMGTSALHIPLSPQINTGTGGGAGSGGLN
tara:strand:- start:346 stop:609 length:264 start_codon:yes stop_codon:yes gene_type:complete